VSMNEINYDDNDDNNNLRYFHFLHFNLNAFYETSKLLWIGLAGCSVSRVIK